MFSREFKKIFKNYFFYRTTPVAVSECICPICIYSFSEAALKKVFLKFRKIKETHYIESLFLNIVTGLCDKNTFFKGESHIDFRKQCFIMTLAVGAGAITINVLKFRNVIKFESLFI